MSNTKKKYPTKGFASMDKAAHHELAVKGGKKCHEYGLAHEWDSDDAKEAGRKGGLASAAAKRKKMLSEI